jgi:type III pantothenate kinase
VILLLDAGNSRIKWRIQQGGEVLARGSTATLGVSELLHAWRDMRAEVVVACCVAGDTVQKALEADLAGKAGRIHWLVAAAEGHGLVSHYQPPESLGADRFAALVAAHRREGRDWVVVNAGSALTADMLTAEGHFLGGCIVPGPEMMGMALERGTAGGQSGQWGRLWQEERSDANWPSCTADAVYEGIGLALAGVVEGMSRRLQGETGRVPRVLLGGGASRMLRPFLRDEVVEVDELVLEGLAWIARDLGYDA